MDISCWTWSAQFPQNKYKNKKRISLKCCTAIDWCHLLLFIFSFKSFPVVCYVYYLLCIIFRVPSSLLILWFLSACCDQTHLGPLPHLFLLLLFFFLRVWPCWSISGLSRSHLNYLPGCLACHVSLLIKRIGFWSLIAIHVSYISALSPLCKLVFQVL